MKKFRAIAVNSTAISIYTFDEVESICRSAAGRPQSREMCAELRCVTQPEVSLIQMCNWMADQQSLNRMDALVWALTELMLTEQDQMFIV